MSDSDTTDSDSGIRFKTTSTRYKSDRTDKYSSSSKSRRSLDSSGRRSRDRDRGRDRRRSSTDRRTDRRSRHSASRSKSRSRSRERRKRRERDRERRRRSRSRSRSKRSSQSRRDRESSPENKIPTPTSTAVTVEVKETSTVVEQSKIEPGKILDISVSSLSSQDDHIGKDEVPEDHFGPALPPAPPSPAKECINHESPSREEKTDEIIGPALPPHLINKQQEVEDQDADNCTRVIGPTLPTDFMPATEAAASSESELSPFSEEEPEADDDDLIGPMPGASSSRSHLELEQRALEMKIRRFDAERYDPKTANATSREDWMLELPDIRKVSDLGLGARQFRTREKLEIGDRTVWTDTPSDKERKKSGQSTSKDPTHDREAEQERRRVADRDKQQEELIKRHKKKHKRDKTLLEIHQKKLKKEKEKKEKSDEPTRRPFDRNVDLHANQFDEAQKKAIYKKAQLLDTRFSGGASKFL